MISSIRFATRYLLHFLAGVAILVPSAVPAQESSVQPAAELPPPAADRAELAHAAARARHAPLAAYAPTALPQALPEGQATDVKFTVLLAGGAAGSQPAVTLNIRGLNTSASVPMRDDGAAPDLSAGDRVYSALVRFSAADATAGRCYDARVSALSVTGQTVLSGVRRVCVTQFAIGIAASDFSALNVIDFSDGTRTVRVLADEAMIRVSSRIDDGRVAAMAALVDGTVVGSLPAERIYQIRLRSSQTADELRQTLLRLQRAGGVLAAVPNQVGLLQAPPVMPVTTTDPLLATQTNLDRIKAKQAWAIVTGDAAVLTAVVDTGADFDHPDFWATSTGTDTRFAISGSDLIAGDCTGSGCVAVSKPLACHATNVCNASNTATDTYGHGTVAAGFAGGAVDNALGIAGATWQGRLLAVRYATSQATSTVAKLADGINYARGQGARIISVSSAAAGGFASTLLCPGVASAEGEGRLVVAAAGNDGGTGTNYPAGCAGGMPVANSTVDGSDQDVIYSGPLASNFGPWVSLAAPGTAVLSTARTPAACPTCDPSLADATGYAAVTGTSFSTPLAAGAAALVLARSPSTTNADLRTLLFSTGVALQAPAAHVNRIDALAALLTFNTAPTAINLSGLCVPENTDSTAGASVGTLTTVDADAGLTTHEYTVVGGADQAKFSVGGAGELVITDGILDFETRPAYAVRIRSTDVGDLFFEQDFIVSVCNINEPPVVADTTFAVAENSPAATPVGAIVATDAEGGALVYAITAGNTGGAFAISGIGEITVANGLALDFETTPVFTLSVTVSDGMNTVPVTVTVGLTDVNEPPAITGGTFSIAENSANGTVVGTIGASDPEGALTLSITAGDSGGAFAISNTGEITVASSAALNFEATPVFVLTVTASDAVTSVPATVTITLTDVAEGIPNPILVFDRMEPGTDAFGNTVDRYFFRVTNWMDYPADFFAPRPDLPPCGLNTSASRAWVDFFRSDTDARLFGFCALGTTDMLNGHIWFGVIPSGGPHPAAVYIKILDRETGIEYTSNSAPIP